MNEQAKAWIDYYVDYLQGLVGALDKDGCIINVTVDKAMHAATINELVNLRERMDGETPVGYPVAKHAYIHDEDLQKLRNLK